MTAQRPLAGKVALITGAAQGIGRSIAAAFANSGAAVAIVDVQRDRGREAAAALQAIAVDAHFIEADLSQTEAPAAMIEACVSKLGRIDFLVNNAAHRERRADSPLSGAAAWEREQSVSLKSCILASKAAEPHFEAVGGGTIVNISSALARSVTLHESVGYHIVKAGLEQLTRCLAYELGPKNIRANAVAPGLVDREQGRKLTDDPLNKAALMAAVPLRRAARPPEIADVVVFLCSDQAAYITGQTLIVDGGLSLGEQFGVGLRSVLMARSDDSPKSDN